jgi:hypothetical protein
MPQHFGRGLMVGASMLAAVGCAKANLLVNGGFEDPAFADNALHYVHLTGTDLTGWTTFSTFAGTVLFNTGYDPVTEGQQAVQIEVPGDSISQSFATVIGADYRLTFDMSAFSGYGGPGLGFAACPCESLLDVSVGPASETVGSSSLGFVTQTLEFTADSSTTTLTLKNPSDPSAIGNYPHVDNVSVIAVPEPETYALMLAGLGALGLAIRRNKGARV